MEMSNFEVMEVKQLGGVLRDYVTICEVDVTTGFFKWKKTERKRVCKNRFSVNWYYEDTGEFTEGYHVEKLVRVYTAVNGKEL
jgi:hypothetical protein